MKTSFLHFASLLGLLAVGFGLVMDVGQFQEYDELGEAAIQILQKLDLNQPRVIDVILIGPYQNYEMIGRIMGASKDMVYRIVGYRSLYGHQKRWNNVIIVSDALEFEHMKEYVNDSLFNFEGLYLIILDDNIDDILGFCRNVFSFFYNLYIVNVSVLRRNAVNHSVDLVTFMPFGPNKCHNTNPIVYNSFDTLKNQFEHDDFFPQKTSNFHGCGLKVVFLHAPPFTEFKYVNDTYVLCGGYEVYLMRTMASVLNFTINPELWYNEQNPSAIFSFENESTTKAVSMLTHGDANITMGSLSITKDRINANLLPSEAYLTTKIILVAPAPQTYGAIEVLLLPFDFVTWILIVTIMSLGCLIILFLNTANKRWRDFVAGENNRAPVMNSISMWINGYSASFPIRNFARTLATLLMFTTLVLRSTYQGSIFGYLKAFKRHEGSMDYNDYLKNGYKVHVSLRMHIVFKDITTKLQYYVLLYSEDEMTYFRKLTEPGFKGLMLASVTSYEYYHQQTSYQYADHPLPEVFFIDRIVMYFRRNSLLRKPLNKVIMNFESGGLFIYYKRHKYYRPIIFDDNRVVAFVSPGWYYLCGIIMLISSFVLVLEIFSLKIKWLGRIFLYLLE